MSFHVPAASLPMRPGAAQNCYSHSQRVLPFRPAEDARTRYFIHYLPELAINCTILIGTSRVAAYLHPLRLFLDFFLHVHGLATAPISLLFPFSLCPIKYQLDSLRNLLLLYPNIIVNFYNIILKLYVINGTWHYRLYFIKILDKSLKLLIFFLILYWTLKFSIINWCWILDRLTFLL